MFKRVLTVLAVLLLTGGALVGLLASEWLPRPRPEATAALAILAQRSPEPSGRSAFAVLWFMQYDVGDGDPDQMLRRDMAAFTALPPSAPGFRSLAADLPPIPLLQEELCAPFPQPCLPGVRAMPDAGAAVRKAYAAQLRNSDGLVQADHYAYPFPLREPLLIPNFGRVINLRRFANAQEFAAGDKDAALASTCRELAAWRRLRPTANFLIHDMIAIAFAQTQAGVLSEILGEWPADQPLAEACSEALSPLAEAELDQCPAWRGEAEYIASIVEAARGQPEENAERPLPGWLHEILINRRNVIGLNAVRLAGGCLGYRASPLGEPRWVDWTFDLVGSMKLSLSSDDDYRVYHDRHLDHLDVLRAVRIQSWLRSQPDRQAAWTQLPAGIGPAPDGLTFEPAADRLVMSFRYEGGQRDGPWFLPLPPALPARPSAG